MKEISLKIIVNPTFWCGLCGWLVAQLTKMLCILVNMKKLDFKCLVKTGGMPSAHSSLICSVATSVGIRYGFDSGIFGLSMAVAILVMFDASTVRRSADIQANILDEMIVEIFKERRFSEKKIFELLGHTPIEVLMGMIIGILVAIIIHSTIFNINL